ncbi:MAG: NAD(+) synthase [Eubacterium sp.]
MEKIKTELIQWIRDWFSKNGPDCNAIIGISGGKDSSVVAALCVEALGKDRVIGVLMPNGVQSDLDDAKQLVSHLGIKNYIINIKDSVDGVLHSMETAGIEITEQTKINLPPRIRMSTLYAVSQSHNGRVANTCNLSEDWIGYSTRYGDSAGDFSPLAHLTVTEVREIGKLCNLPENLVQKIPSDGLSGMSDEEKIGFSYDTLDRYIRTGMCEDTVIKTKIDRMYKMNRFKLEIMPSFPNSGKVEHVQ